MSQLTLERDLDEQQRALDEDQHTGDVQLSKGVDGHDGGENSKDGVDVGPEHGDARQEIVQLVGFVEGVRQLLDLRKNISCLSRPVQSHLSYFTWTKAPMLATIAKLRITISAP